ncbi:formyl transferase/ C-terminal domain protein [Synechococcus sp. NOUM97013]|nr:formyl transferase/ C-terminal domain protein [Synechococcus sp. NOUM97013]
MLINDEKEFGITVHYIDDGVDTGDIVLQRTYPISDSDDYGSLLATAYGECPLLLHEAIKLIKSGQASRLPQKSVQPCGSIYSQRRLGDETIDWNSSSREIFNFVRALSYPGPLAQTKFKGINVYIAKAELVDGAPKYKCIPGALLARDDFGFLVKTGDSYIRIVEWISESRLYVGERFF